MRKILNIASRHALSKTFSKELGISEILAQVLVNRGITSIAEAENFLNVNLDHLLDPNTFSDMSKAVSLIRQTLKHKEKVMVFSDYDVDGITSLALLKHTLSKIGLDVIHYLPHRIREGYGLNKNIIHLIKQKNIKLLITADCGTNSQEEIKELRSHNINVIITDHHEPISEELTNYASVLINPKVKGSNYKFRDLAGVGVVYKLCQALTGEQLFEELDLVCLGTIADVVPLTGENRVIAKEGLARLNQTQRPGLKALIRRSGIEDKEITSGFVSYILGPRINASGRMDTAEVALNLLMSEFKEESEQIAQIIESHNRQRQKIENKILEEAQALINQEVNFKEHRIIVLAKDDWHAGVLGIVASKLADRFYRPTIVISRGHTLCKGSGRSIKNFHLFQALLDCKEFLKTFGGHSQAVGLVITKDSIEDFKNKINRLAKEKLVLEDLLPSLDIDMELALLDLNPEVVREFKMLEPFGTGNPEPLFYTRGLKLKSKPLVLGRGSLKFWVTDDTVTYPVIGFGMGGLENSLKNCDYFDLVYSPRMDDWQEEENIILEARDIFFR